MSRLRRFAIAALAAATVTVGSLATVSPASAAMKCSTATALASAYIATGDVFFALGYASKAAAYYGKAQGIMQGACS